jgi:tetratricopeptide (TPR) repeat protein
MSKIFISYSHKDEEWKDKVVSYLKNLEMKDYCNFWDDRKIEVGDDWFIEIETALNEAHIAIMMITTDFLASNFIRNEEIPRILYRRRKEGLRVIPLIVKPCNWRSVQWLESIQVTPKDGKPLSVGNNDYVDEELTKLSEKITSLLKRKSKPRSITNFIPLPPEDIFLSKLPITGVKLFGREDELKILDEAWEDEHTHIVTLVAWGGVGKTALVNHWLSLIERDNYRGSIKVYGWSFYSQGAAKRKQASADEFMQETLKWFGDKDPAEGSAVEKGKRLANLIRKESTLLILDGLEPLQYPPGEGYGLDGQLKDQGLKILLKELSSGQPGLCVITTREKVADLSAKIDFTVKEISLEHLSNAAGTQFLKSLGITGPDKEILKAVEEYDGHALALSLLGRYLHSVYRGDIRKRDKIPKLTKERSQGGHARRVMEAYEKWFQKLPEWKFLRRFKRFCHSTTELNILYLMGLFDRTAEKGAIEALKMEPSIPGVTEQLQELSEEDWQYALINLRDANLIAKENPQKPDDLDCHPLIREHFNEKLREQNHEGWKIAHQRLYHYYKNLPEKEYPDTLQEMEPLYAAIAHGCQAELHQETFKKVWWRRTKRENNQYSTKILGAFSSDIGALSHFFDVFWDQPNASLSNHEKAGVLSWAAFDLVAVGRLQEAIQPMKAGFDAYISQKDWRRSAMAANNISELMMTLGDVCQAVDFARQSVIHAERSGDSFWKIASRTLLSDAFFQSGKLVEAEKLFQEAETMQREIKPEYPYLYEIRGFKYCDLLLEQGNYKEVLSRAEKALKFAIEKGQLLSIALDNLSLGRTWMMKTQKEGSDDSEKAKYFLVQAISVFREAGQQQYLALGLLTRAAFYRWQQEFSKAFEDINEAKEIVELGSMKLYLADYHLEAGRLYFEEGRKKEANQHLKIAKEMIRQMGYHRRDRDIENLAFSISNLASK